MRAKWKSVFALCTCTRSRIHRVTGVETPRATLSQSFPCNWLCSHENPNVLLILDFWYGVLWLHLSCSFFLRYCLYFCFKLEDMLRKGDNLPIIGGRKNNFSAYFCTKQRQNIPCKSFDDTISFKSFSYFPVMVLLCIFDSFCDYSLWHPSAVHEFILLQWYGSFHFHFSASLIYQLPIILCLFGAFSFSSLLTLLPPKKRNQFSVEK